MKNVLILSRNYKDYMTGLYYQDLINGFVSKHKVFLYGPGYVDYSNSDSLEDVVLKSSEHLESVDLIVVSNSWGDENSANEIFDVHTNICLAETTIPCVYFLNKEYKKLKQKLRYIEKNKFNVIYTVQKNHDVWAKETGLIFKTMPFGVDLKRFKPLRLPKIYDFSFMGALHRNWGVTSRYEMKKILFKPSKLTSLSSKSRWLGASHLHKKYKKYNIYWAEWGAKDIFNNELTLNGEEYLVFLNQSRFFFNSLSAEGIFNTRFLELMATKTLIFCPKSVENYGILKDGVNAVMFNDNFSDLEKKFESLIKGEIEYEKIVDQAFKDVQGYTYENIVDSVLLHVGLSNLILK